MALASPLCGAGCRCLTPLLPGEPLRLPPSYAPEPPRRPARHRGQGSLRKMRTLWRGCARARGGTCELGTRTSARGERARVRIERPVRALVGRNEDWKRIGPPSTQIDRCRWMEGPLPLPSPPSSDTTGLYNERNARATCDSCKCCLSNRRCYAAAAAAAV